MAKHRHVVRKGNKKIRKLSAKFAADIQQALKYQQSGYINEAELIYKNILDQDPEQTDSLHFLGMLCHQRGNNEQAIIYIEKSIKIDKNNPIFLNNYGLVLEKLNKLDAAINAFQKAIKYKSDYAESWFNLALTFSRTLNYESAENAYIKAIQIKPDYIKALYNLASIQEIQGKQELSDKTIKSILDISPHSAEVHNTLGSVFYKLGGVNNYLKAEIHFHKAIESKPDFLGAYINLGMLLEEGNNTEGAIKCYLKVLELEPQYLDAKLKLALALIKQEEIKKSVLYITQILEISPKNTEALSGLGNIKLMQGRFNEAKRIFEDVIKINNEMHSAYFGLAQCTKITLQNDKEFINELKSRSKIFKNSFICFALGKVNNDIGDYDSAFDAYKEGNDIKNKKIVYDKNKNTEKINEIIRTFSKGNINKLAAGSCETDLPVFIVGTPRSGTTLVEQILSSHPFVFGAGELTYIQNQLKQISKKYGKGTGIPDGVDNLTTKDILYYSNEYIEKIKNLCDKGNVLKITDKMPGNYLYLGYILSIFPGAKIIHCKRHPLDTCLSIYFQLFHSRHEYSFNLENLGHWYKDYLVIMDYWDGIFGNNILTVDYSDTVNDLENTVSKLLEHCGLDWDEHCLKFYETNREIKTASQWQVRQPIYKTSFERWKNFDKHISVLKDILEGYY